MNDMEHEQRSIRLRLRSDNMDFLCQLFDRHQSLSISLSLLLSNISLNILTNNNDRK